MSQSFTPADMIRDRAELHALRWAVVAVLRVLSTADRDAVAEFLRGRAAGANLAPSKHPATGALPAVWDSLVRAHLQALLDEANLASS